MKSTSSHRILLSVPHMSGLEQVYVQEAFDSNWLSTAGPNIVSFENEFEQYIGLPSVALASGTAGIHLGLRLLGVSEGDEVLCQTLTFVASANPILYQGARPIFVDSEQRSWNLDPNVLAEVLKRKAESNCLPKALVVVHLFGQCADMDPILSLCGEFGIPVLEDAAEALGATYKGRSVGTLGAVGVFSFNGNKLITTTGGGMLVSADRRRVDKARFWACQARDTGLAYEHSEAGYNYRLSNVLAGIGRGQLRVADLRVKQRRAIAFRYATAFDDVTGIALMPQASYGLHTNWLSVFEIDAEAFGCSRDELIAHLDAAGIESRPVWKPMHLQSLFAGYEYAGGNVAQGAFERGICLPSSSSLSARDQLRVINTVRGAAGYEPTSFQGRSGLADPLLKGESPQRWECSVSK